MKDIMKIIFKMILTGVLAMIINDLIIILLGSTGIISYETWQNTPFLHHIYTMSIEPDNSYLAVLNAKWDYMIGTIFALIPLVIFIVKKHKK